MATLQSPTWETIVLMWKAGCGRGVCHPPSIPGVISWLLRYMGDNGVSLRNVSALSPSYPWPQFSFCCFFFSPLLLSAQLWFKVAGLTYDNYFLGCAEGLLVKDAREMMALCAPLYITRSMFETFTYVHCFTLQSGLKKLLWVFSSCLNEFPCGNFHLC